MENVGLHGHFIETFLKAPKIKTQAKTSIMNNVAI